jgi:hypothetical protein
VFAAPPSGLQNPADAEGFDGRFDDVALAHARIGCQ